MRSKTNITRLITGVDEVGRGPCFGSVVTAAVSLDPVQPILELKDSKAVLAKKHASLNLEIKDKALCYGIAEASAEEIDRLNILQAAMLAMIRAVEKLMPVPSIAMIDGNRIPEGLPCPAEFVIKSDTKVEAIMAASILTKEFRDNQIIKLAEVYPGYGLESHKGYGTKQHLEAIKTLGVTPLHRRSFKPVKEALGIL